MKRFGDTVNTTARIEVTSESGRIHCSQATADCLIQSGKGSWLTKRDDPIEAKGKGHMQTYWINPSGNNAMSATGSTTSTAIPSPILGNMIGDLEELYGSVSNSEYDLEAATGGASGRFLMEEGGNMPPSTKMLSTRFSSRTRRLIEWNTETLLRYLKEIVARREATASASRMSSTKKQVKRLKSSEELSSANISDKETNLSSNNVFLHEVKEIIELPDLDANDAATSSYDVMVGDDVAQQLREYVTW